MLKWARQRSGLDSISFAKFLNLKNPSVVNEWEQTGEIRLTQLEKIAKKAYVPVGYLFLDTPPEDKLPIPDFRKTTDTNSGSGASSELIDTIRLCQFRQDWFEDKVIKESSKKLGFVHSAEINSSIQEIAASIRYILKIDDTTFRSLNTWEDSLRTFVEKIDNAGILVMRSGIVGNNTHRKLNVNEFRGFTLNSLYSPLIFVNSRDSKSAQMFTLAHELSHVWLGQSGVSNLGFDERNKIETFCNKIASEVLVPSSIFINDWNHENDVQNEAKRIARLYKVSTLVILIKAFQHNFIESHIFENLFDKEMSFKPRMDQKSSGGDFYLTQGVRLSRRFINEVVTSTYEGFTTYVEAFQLLGIKKSTTFKKMAEMNFVRN